METSQQQQGVFAKWWSFLFGQRAKRLSESVNGAHLLSYLLVLVQSVAVVLALGHQELQWLFNGDTFAQFVAAAALFLLIATVFAADLCVLKTLRRVPALFRNQQSWGMVEHMAYMVFVLTVEGVTLFIVLAAIDANPQALISAASLIPATGLTFFALLGARVLMVGWTMVQLNIVSGKLAPQWATLILQGKELIGGKAQEKMANLNLDDVSLASLIAGYAAMEARPAPVERWYNKWSVRHRRAMLANEDAAREHVSATLSAFDRNGTYYSGPRLLDSANVVAADYVAPETSVRQFPVASAPAAPRSAGKVRNVKPRGLRNKSASNDSLEPVAMKVWRKGMKPEDLRVAMSAELGRGVSGATAQRWHAKYATLDKTSSDTRSNVAVGE